MTPRSGAQSTGLASLREEETPRACVHTQEEAVRRPGEEGSAETNADLGLLTSRTVREI